MPVISHFIPKEKEGTYYTLPFEVPEGVSRIIVSYSYTHGARGTMGDIKPTNTVDLGLADENGKFLGWSGSAHDTIFVGEFESSKGYLTKKIQPGKWNIIIGAYHIEKDGVTVEYDINFEKEKTELLFGDLHIHSTASDGQLTAYELGILAKKKGLDFIALANHNNFAENYALPQIENLTYIPAVEWTHYKGHMNFFGIKNPFENSFIANTKEDMKKIVADAKALGATISVNHPKCPFCPYLWEEEDSLDMIEIWNGPMRPSNMKAIAWWTELLKKGRKISCVGGSDFHKPNTLPVLANPVTGVFAKSRNAEKIFSEIKSGHSFVAESVNGPWLLISYENKIQGDTVKFKESVPLKIKAEKLKHSDLYLVTEKGEKLISKRCKNFESEVFIEKCKFIYLVSKKGHGKTQRVLAITNPIYFN